MKEIVFNQIWKKVQPRIIIMAHAIISDQIRYSLNLSLKVKCKNGGRKEIKCVSLFVLDRINFHKLSGKDLIKTMFEAEKKLKNKLKNSLEDGYLENISNIYTIYFDKNGREINDYDIEIEDEDNDEEREMKLKELTAQKITTQVIKRTYFDIQKSGDVSNLPRLKKLRHLPLFTEIFMSKHTLLKTLIERKNHYLKQKESIRELSRALSVGYSENEEKEDE